MQQKKSPEPMLFTVALLARVFFFSSVGKHVICFLDLGEFHLSWTQWTFSDCKLPKLRGILAVTRRDFIFYMRANCVPLK